MEKRTVKPEVMVELIKEEGENVAFEQAVFDYWYKMAEITLSVIFEEENDSNS